jgi:hypothetical protein
MRRGSLLAAAGTAIVILGAAAASAQTPTLAHRVELSGGLLWSGGYSIGDRAADLRRNTIGADPPPLTLFRADSTFASSAGVEGRVGFALTRAVAVEGAVAWSRPHIDVTIAEDVEGANTSFDGETTSQYVIEASVIWTLPVTGDTARLRPFVLGGGGYLRQLHDENTLAANGQLYHVGGGVRYFFRGADGAERPVGVRGDVRAYIRVDGIEFEEKTRTYPAVSALLFFGF